MKNATTHFEQVKKKWFSKFEKYKIRYKNGFYQIPNLSNTPQTIVDSFDKLFFCNHDKEKKTLSSNTIFCNAKSYYCKIEPGLWIFRTSAHYKKNVAFIFKPDSSLELDYYVIKLYFQKSSIEKSMLIKGLTQPLKAWAVFKCNKKIDTYHFKDTHDVSMMMHFNKQWLENKLKEQPNLKESGILHFLNSKNPFLLLGEKEELINYFSKQYLNYFQMDDSPDKQRKIKQLSIAFFDCFLEKYKSEGLEKIHFKIDDHSRIIVRKAKAYLINSLPHGYPGIEKISKKMGISPTKLKHDFKIIHQQSIFQFYRQRQMEQAYQILSEGEILIKELANQMGYASVGKFSSAFKNQFGVLPSEMLKRQDGTI